MGWGGLGGLTTLICGGGIHADGDGVGYQR